MAGKKRRQKWARQAALQTLLRFGPEESGLEELHRQAQENYQAALRTADSTAMGTIGAINRAIPEVEGIYDRAGLEASRTADTLIGSDLAGLGSVADSIKAGAALEVAAQLGNLREARSRALTGLREQRVGAQAGAGYAKQAAQEQLVSDLTKIMERKQGLRREKGAFTALTISQLEEAARKEAADFRRLTMQLGQQERNSKRSAGIDPDTNKPIPGGKLDPKTKKPKNRQSNEKHLEATTKLDEALTWLKRLDPAKAERGHFAPLLATGAKQPAQKPQQVYDPQTGKRQLNPDGTPKMTGGTPAREVPGVGALFASAAADVYYDGHLSRRNEKRLRLAGFSLKRLGLPTYEQWRRKGKPKPRRTRKQLTQTITSSAAKLPSFRLDPLPEG